MNLTYQQSKSYYLIRSKHFKDNYLHQIVAKTKLGRWWNRIRKKNQFDFKNGAPGCAMFFKEQAQNVIKESGRDDIEMICACYILYPNRK
jgi:hypothetical protein